MPRVILALIVIGITIYAVIDCLRTPDADIRVLPKPLWLLVILALPLVGGLMWIGFGADRSGSGPGGRAEPRVIAPDDDPDFLRQLDRNKKKQPPSEPS